MNWTHVVFVYTSDEYGIAGRDSFLSQAADADITAYAVSVRIFFKYFKFYFIFIVKKKKHLNSY